MASKSKSIVGNKMKKKGNNRGGSSAISNKSFQRTAMEKLRKHPSCLEIEYGAEYECGENEIATMAKSLTDPETIMNTHFSQMIHHPVSMKFDEQMEEAKSEFVTSAEEDARSARSIFRVEDAAKLEVKLLLRKIDSLIPSVTRTAAAVLNMEYGPLHASLLINDDLLLEWNTGSLVVPERYDGDNQRYPIITSALHRVNTVSRIKYNEKDELDLIFEATRSKIDMLNGLIKIISRYNGQYFYHAVSRNCQTFVIDALNAMGCENAPKFEGNLQRYFKSLKAGRNYQPEFEGHDELDHHVKETVLGPQAEPVSAQEKEYLLGQYFLFHIRTMTEAEEPDSWVCPRRECQMKNLEINIDEQSMIMHRFLDIKEAGRN